MEKELKRYISWSGGKDSSASIIVCHEKGIKIDGVIFVEVMFDKKRGISGENPEHIEWIYNTAIPIIEKDFGYPVTVLRADRDYLDLFYQKIQNSKIPERNGKYSGFLMGGMCAANSRLKMSPIEKWNKSVGVHEEIIGIASDEFERYKNIKENKRSVLIEYDITEKMTYDICEKYNLLSPIYENESRGGCWFCPNASIKSFAMLAKKHPELWEELRVLSKETNVVSQGFKYGKTFAEVDNEVEEINKQITFYDEV